MHYPLMHESPPAPVELSAAAVTEVEASSLRCTNAGGTGGRSHSAGDALLLPRYPPPEELLSSDGEIPVTVRVHISTWLLRSMSASDATTLPTLLHSPANVESVDSKEQLFCANLWLQLEWLVRLPIEVVETDGSGVKWRPKLTWTNLRVSGSIEERNFRAVEDLSSDDGQRCTRCFLTHTLHGQFVHRFNLRMFPFDLQVLEMKAVLWGSPSERVVASAAETGGDELVKPYVGRVDFTCEQALIYESEFALSDVWKISQNHPVIVRQGVTDERLRSSRDGQRFCTLTIGLALKRRWPFYGWNVMREWLGELGNACVGR